jgi:tripartite-type tricarboxylate transporter receptor subunit TctC
MGIRIDLVSRIAKAQTCPARPITIIVPYTPGGSSDVIGRLLMERMRASLTNRSSFKMWLAPTEG